MINKTSKLSLLALSISTLVACGGGGGGGSSEPTPQQPQPSTVSGRAIDGPLAASTVTFVDCANQTTITDATGFFNFPAGCTSSALVVTGGSDTATGLPFEGTLMAPKQTAQPGANQLVVTPITTLVQSLGGIDKVATIAAALGISANDLLTADPTKNQELYKKTVAVQQLVEEIQQAIAALGTSSSSEDLSKIAFKAVADALSNAPATGGDPLTNTSIISAALSNTLEAVKDELPANVKDNLANVKANLAALTAASIAHQIEEVEAAIAGISNFNPSQDNTNLIKQATQAAIVSTKTSIGTEKLIGLLGTVLTLNSNEAATLLAGIAENINSETPDTAAIEAALNQIAEIAAEQGITIVIDDELVESVVKPEEFYASYLKIDGLTAAGTTYTVAELLKSVTSPIRTAALDNLLVSVNATGNLAGTTQTVGVSLHVDSTKAEKVTVAVDKLNLTFTSAGALSAAKIAPGATLSLKSDTRSGSFVLPNEVNVLANGNIALNTTVLTQLLPSHLKDQLAGLTPTGATKVTATLNAANTPVAYSTTSGLALAPKYTLGTTTGYGIIAGFNIAQ